MHRIITFQLGSNWRRKDSRRAQERNHESNRQVSNQDFFWRKPLNFIHSHRYIWIYRVFSKTEKSQKNTICNEQPVCPLWQLAHWVLIDTLSTCLYWYYCKTLGNEKGELIWIYFGYGKRLHVWELSWNHMRRRNVLGLIRERGEEQVIQLECWYFPPI